MNYLVRDVKSAVMMPNGLGEKSRWVQKTVRHFFGIKSGGWCYDFNDLLRAALPQFLLAIHMENCWDMENFASHFMENCSNLPRYGCSLWLCHRDLSLVESFREPWILVIVNVCTFYHGQAGTEAYKFVQSDICKSSNGRHVPWPQPVF